MLRDSKTWNHIASNLEPEVPDLRLEEHSLRSRPYYPDGLKFTTGKLWSGMNVSRVRVAKCGELPKNAETAHVDLESCQTRMQTDEASPLEDSA